MEEKAFFAYGPFDCLKWLSPEISAEQARQTASQAGYGYIVKYEPHSEKGTFSPWMRTLYGWEYEAGLYPEMSAKVPSTSPYREHCKMAYIRNSKKVFVIAPTPEGTEIFTADEFERICSFEMIEKN